METNTLEIVCDSGGIGISPRNVSDLLVMIEAIHTVCHLKHADDYTLNISQEEIRGSIEAYLGIYLSSPFRNKNGTSDFSRLIRGNNGLGTQGIYDEVMAFHSTLARSQFSLKPEKNYRLLTLEALSYTNPIRFRVTTKGSIKALVIAVIICGGEIDIKNGKAKLPGLVDTLERVVHLVGTSTQEISNETSENETYLDTEDDDFETN